MTRLRLPLLVAAVALAVLATSAPGGATPGPAAGRPAPVKITLKSDGTGRVTSHRAGCVSRRIVYAFARSGNQVAAAGTARTDRHGRYPAGSTRRGVSGVLTLVTGNGRCRVAQSRSTVSRRLAAAPAERKVTFQADPTSASGQVISNRQACVAEVPIVLFSRAARGEPFVPVVSSTTDGTGQFGFGAARAWERGQHFDLFVLAIGDAACRVAQSPTRTVR